MTRAWGSSLVAQFKWRGDLGKCGKFGINSSEIFISKNKFLLRN